MGLRHSTLPIFQIFKRHLSAAVLATFLVSLMPVGPLAEALSKDAPGGSLPEIRKVDSVEDRYGIVAILVQEDLWNSSARPSSFFSFFGNDGLAGKIETYAEDIQATVPWTKTMILTVSDDETPVDIQKTLERLYFEGNPQDDDLTKLAGVVVIGDVPLPVVNKNGYRFVSLLPYTDFEEPSYVLDDATQDFVRNSGAQELQPEVWHGVIVPPLDGQEGIDLLSAFFDKNHAFHDGDADAATFDKKTFVADLVTEENTVNPVSFGAYQRFLNLWEQISYYRYSNDLLTDVYTDMQSTVEEGDKLDNDGDGLLDEEASNGIDDDGDGLVDEDLGDGFYHIDNDGDGKIDEDGSADNNNDKDFIFPDDIDLNVYRGEPHYAEDRAVDEDPPGDTTGGPDNDGDGIPDGDGCPGLCNKDDNGDGKDNDGDGYPDGLEKVLHTDPADEKEPWPAVMNFTNEFYDNACGDGTCSDSDEATAWWAKGFKDQFYYGREKSETCFADDGSYHPEWDDDEDGFCDEDGTDQLVGACAYNDGDCDGVIDEDPEGLQPEALFDGVPDIQSKKVIEGLIKRYAQIFDQPQGVWNRLVNESGRYKTQYLNTDGKARNDYDSPVALIAKKDEYTLQYLRDVNDVLEEGVDKVVKNHLAKDIPIIGLVEVTGSYTTADSETEKPACVPGQAPDLGEGPDYEGNACLQFFNSAETELGRTLYYSVKDYLSVSGSVGNILMNGKHLWEIDSPKECTLYAGTDEEGGQLTQFNAMYGTSSQGLNEDEIKLRKNCVAEYAAYKDAIPELCSTATTEADIRDLGAAKKPGEDEDATRYETGPEACFEFREWSTLTNYSKIYTEFNDWLTSKIRRFSRDGESSSDPQNYNDFLAEVETQRGAYTTRPDKVTLRKHFNELDVLSMDADHDYTISDLMEDLGFSDPSDDDIDTYLALHDDASVNSPTHGTGMSDVDNVTVQFNKYYYADGSHETNILGGDFTPDVDYAKKISSFYKSAEPENDTLNAQMAEQISPDMPIDATRRVSFIDRDDQAQTVNYVNVFRAQSAEEVKDAIDAMAATVGSVAGGSAYESTVRGLKSDINMDQLADALAWKQMSIDEKHTYVLTHYLGDQEPLVAKARNGYEMSYLVANGEANSIQFSFNGNKPTNDGDLEWLYRSQEAAETAMAADAETGDGTYEPISDVSNTTPVPLFDWIDAIADWLAEVNDSLTNFGTYGGGNSCGDPAVSGSSGTSGSTADTNDDGVPDEASLTASLKLSSEDNNLLQTDGKGVYTVTVSAEKADGSLNTGDSFTEVDLKILTGSNSVSIAGNSSFVLSGGVATFVLFSADEGDFSVQAVTAESGIRDSNVLSGSVVSKFVKVTSYVTRAEGSGTTGASAASERIQIKDFEGNVVATVDPATGELDLDGAEAVLKQATDSLPTRVAIEAVDGGATYAILFLIPEEKHVSTGDGTAGVFVNAVNSSAGTASAENGVALEVSGVQMGLVTETGQIVLSDAYSLAFENPEAVNLYDPLLVTDARGTSLFTVTIRHSFSTGSIVEPSGEHEGYLSSLLRFLSGIPGALAAGLVPDSDKDGLDDLEEWTVGTREDHVDSDGDFYTDFEEIYAGYDPLKIGGKLFSDIDAGNPAYASLAKLYVRGVVKGYSDGSFRPDNPITREEFVKIDLGSICKQCDRYSESYKAALMAEYEPEAFPDTDINPELLACVAEAKVSDIVSGYAGGEDKGYFVPKQNISRAEATKVLVETAGFSVPAATADELWYAEYVKVAQENNLFPEGASVTDAWLQAAITRSEFVMMAVNLVEAKDCRMVDSDGDGISDTEESVLYGTNPKGSDTDGGGVSDLDEILRGSDPLDASDDFPGEAGANGDGTDSNGGETGTGTSGEGDAFVDFGAFDHEPGLYVVSSQAEYETISGSLDSDLGNVNVYTTQLPADGDSSVFVRAEIRDAAGNVYTDDDSSIVDFVLSSSTYGKLASESVKVSDGLAETTFDSSEVAGDLTVTALLRDGSLPSESGDLEVYAGAPVRLTLEATSSVIPAGGEAADDVTLSLYDVFNNVANHDFYSVTLRTEGGLSLLDLADEDTDASDTQVTTSDGVLHFRVLSSAQAETGTVTAFLTEQPDVSITLTIDQIEGMQLLVTPSAPFMLTGGSSPQTVAVTAVDETGATVTGYQGDVSLAMDDASYGVFAPSTITLRRGEGSTELSPGTLAGNASILASSSGLSSSSATVEFKPSKTVELRIRTKDGASTVSAGSTAQFLVEAYDEYGNVVTTDSSTSGTLRLTDVTAAYGTLSSDTFVLNQGSAPFSVTMGETSGTLNLVAAATGLLAGTWGGDIDYTLDGEDFKAMNPQSLYTNLLGGPFGDVTTENYVGGWMTFNGKTQAVSTLISEPTPKKPMASVDAHGAISLSEDGLVGQSILSAGSTLPTQIQWRSVTDGTLFAKLFFVLSSLQHVSTTLLTDSDDFVVDSSDGELLLRDDSAGAVKVRADGQVEILDPQYFVEVNGAADGLGLIVFKNTEQVMTIDYTNAWDTDVQKLDSDFDLEKWRSLSEGIYVVPTATSDHNFESMPTGNSTANPMGLTLVDPTQELSKDMQPSLGYASLESAENDGTVGWENENKNMLLFAAGNIVGQASLYYPSEVGVVLGDPTVKVVGENEMNELGYTSDLGTMVDASSKDLLQLLNLDYNGDDKQDVLEVYEDGEIDVLQNYNAAVRLQSRGQLLNIENGISSIDAGDFNGDGLDDLFIVTKESCYADEICAYVYRNIGGGFVAENVPLTQLSGKPTQVEVSDLNDDGYDDLVIVDENMVVYLVWNNNGTLGDVDELKDFGLTAQADADLSGDVVAHYNGLEEGSVTLGVDSTDLSTSDVGDLEDFVSRILGDSNFSASVEGSESGTVTRKENLPFEYADADSVSSHLKVTKTFTDDNGGQAEMGDSFTAHVTLENVSGLSLLDVYWADSVSSFYTYQSDSLACSNCAGANALAPQSGDLNRPFIAGPFTFSRGQKLEFTYTLKVSSLPQLSLMVGQDLYSDTTDDDFADIAISPEGNTSGELKLFYSNGSMTISSGGGVFGLGADKYERVRYKEKTYSPAVTDYNRSIPNPLEDNDGDGVPDFIQNLDQEKGIPVPKTGFDVVKDVLGGSDKNGDGYYSTDEMFSSSTDSDGDGLNDTIDGTPNGVSTLIDPSVSFDGDTVDFEATVGALDEGVSTLTDTVESIVSALTCNGGCISFAGSIAFLAAGTYHDPLTGTTVGVDMGTPVFGITPNPPYVCSGQACLPTSQFRLYIAPTTTLGLGMGICVAPYGGQCIAFNIPLLQLLGVCDAINGFIADGMSKATAFLSDDSTGTSAYNVPPDQSGSGDESLGSAVFSTYVPKTSTNTNIQVPGFPSIFTEWWKAQKEELFKMLDLPDVTFIYPDPKSFSTEFSGIRQKALKNEENKAIDLDQDAKVEELTSGVLGLEKFLNWAHALPLIDIKPKKVYVRYPAFTEEEIEAVQQDASQWVNDTKASFAAFKAQFDVRDDLTDEKREAFASLERTVNEAIDAVENNMATLESYTHLPEEILKLRDAQAEYAKVIICYLDAILKYSAGYLTENVARIQAWGQWVVDLRKIVDGWKVIIDLSKDYMDSCDKCTNQRWNGMQLLFSLFVFIPDLPVIELPKLPDIVIDVSHIQAGVDIVWPDIQFIPERINIPRLPRLSFPSADINLNADLNFDIDIPQLPTFDVNVEFPQLPGLTLPELPTLPPPPAIPEIDPTLKVGLKIVGSVLKIICIVRNGFMPVAENNLKTKIEDITERPGTVMPFDLVQTVEWPKFNFDFLKKIQIDTYLNFTGDFTGLYDVVSNLGDQMSGFSTDFSEFLSLPLEELGQQIQDALNTAGSPSVELDVGVEGEGSVDLDTSDTGAYVEPSMKVAQQYKDNPLVSERLDALKNIMGTLQSEIDAWKAGVPEEVKLTAKDRVLALDDPLLHHYDAIARGNDWDKDFLQNIEGTPLASLMQIQDSMTAYVNDWDKTTGLLKKMDQTSFFNRLAKENPHEVVGLAEDEAEGSLSTGGEWDPKTDATRGLDITLAEDDSVEDTLKGLNLGADPQAANTGLFLYNPAAGVNTRLIDYTHGADLSTHILMLDIDDDGDKDVVYSMAGDVYVKENHLKKAKVHYASSDPTVGTLSDFAPAYGNTKNFKRGKNDYQQASFSMDEAPEATGYEVLFYDSLDAMQSSPAENVKRLLLLAETEVPKEMPEDYPPVYESRLTAQKVSGTVKLKNAAPRTFIGTGGEVEMDDSMLLQTLESTRVEVRQDDATVGYDVPAGVSILLGSGHQRTVRVDSGSVYWIDTTQTVTEQNLEEGMEILPQEMVTLEGSASAQLVTTEGATIDLDKEELFVMDQLTDPSAPSSEIDLENGAYYTKLYGLYNDGSWGTVSENVLLNPQVCADDSSPFSVISEGSSIDLAIFSTTTLSAESSFDSESGIGDASWDLDDSVDSDGDGNSTNDPDVLGLTTTVGPYDSTGPKIVTLSVSDLVGNTSSSTITVNVYVPNMTLTEATTQHVSGTTDPESPALPFHLIRERDGALQEIGSGYKTDDSGAIEVDTNSSDLLSVLDADGTTIAQFNPRTKQVLVYDPAYDVTFVSADATWPSRLVVYEKASGIVMASFVFVSDSSLPIVTLSQSLSSYDLSSLNRMTVHFVGDASAYESTATQITAHSGDGSIDLLINNTDNITVFNTDRFSVVREDADSLEDYLILDVFDRGEKVMEIWPGSSDESQVSTATELGLPASQPLGLHEETSSTAMNFSDLSKNDPLYDSIQELVDRGVLEGYQKDGVRSFEPESVINRAEFTKIILGILCIVPRDEAKVLPSVFSDILDPAAWYYAYTKESFLLGLITGYLGEVNSVGVAPFKPASTITRAEATKIMLEALNEEKIITLPEDLTGEPWYVHYLEIAQDLTPYMNSEATGGEETYILTKEEAAQPNHILTRYEFVEMSARVLKAYNCFDIDSDGDGLVNFDEETVYGTDPYDPDTDDGGVNDGIEVGRGTAILDASDDFASGSLTGAESGIYAIGEACMSCPCNAQIDYSADLREGDTVFTVIQNDAGEIFGKSNVLPVTSP